jgi:hypothetical protein
MDSADLQQLQSHVQATNNWTVQNIPVQSIIDVSLPRAEWSLRTINLADHILWQRPGSCTKGKRIYLADFSADSADYHREQLLPTLWRTCRPEGFELIQHQYTNSTLTPTLQPWTSAQAKKGSNHQKTKGKQECPANNNQLST